MYCVQVPAWDGLAATIVFKWLDELVRLVSSVDSRNFPSFGPGNRHFQIKLQWIQRILGDCRHLWLILLWISRI